MRLVSLWIFKHIFSKNSYIFGAFIFHLLTTLVSQVKEGKPSLKNFVGHSFT